VASKILVVDDQKGDYTFQDIQDYKLSQSILGIPFNHY
jgi:hypothetical protein